MPKKRSEEADPLRIYLDEIGAIPLLTPEEEIDLADRIIAGEIEARNELVRRNLRLVVTIAKSYWGIPLQDLVQEGNIGLMHAAEKFDPRTHGTKFDTYAQYHVRRELRRALLKQKRTVYLPATAQKRYRRWCEVRKHLKDQTGFTPTFREIAAEMGITHPNGLSELREIVDAMQQTRRKKSTDHPLSSKGETTLGECLPAVDSRPDAPLLAQATAHHRKQLLIHAQHMIDAHPQSDERSVIQQRYFSGTDEPVSFTVLGKLNGFRRQTMQQREGRIMKSLRERAKKAVEDAILADIPCAPYRSSGGIP